MKKINKQKWIDADVLHKEMMKDPKYRRAYAESEAEFQIASQMIEARIKQNISQEELAKKINTGQAVISRLEGMCSKPSISLLERVARALNIKFNITIQ
jgi:ribosome-binding protein aMBF1 (putative translation factor)